MGIGLSVTGYAKHRGVSQPAVSKAVKQGRITLLEDGSIDPKLADKQWSDSVSRVNLKSNAKKFVKTKKIDYVVDALEADAKVVAAESLDYEDIPDSLTLTEAKTRHEIIKARKSQMDLIRERGELTDVSLVNKHLFTVSREIRDSWLNWVNQVSGEMSAELKVDQHTFTILLEKKVKENLNNLADTDFKIIL